MAKGSCMELGSQLILAKELNYVTDEENYTTCIELIEDISSIIYALTKTKKSSL